VTPFRDLELQLKFSRETLSDSLDVFKDHFTCQTEINFRVVFL